MKDINLLVLLLTSQAQRTFVKEMLEDKGFNVPDRIFGDMFTEAPLLCINLLNKIAVPIVESLIIKNELTVEYIDMEGFIQTMNELPDFVKEVDSSSEETEEDKVKKVIEGVYEDDKDECNNCLIHTESDDTITFILEDYDDSQISVTIDIEVLSHIIEQHNEEMTSGNQNVVRNSCACPTSNIEKEAEEELQPNDLNQKYPGMKLNDEMISDYKSLNKDNREEVYNMIIGIFAKSKDDFNLGILPTFEEFNAIQYS